MSLKVTYQKDSNLEPAAGQPPAGHKPYVGTDIADQQIWKEFKQGKDAAYAYIYKCNARELYSYGTSIYDDPPFIKDCIHDMFLDLWRRRKKLSDIISIRPYLLKALRNKILKEKSKKKLFRTSVDNNYNFQFELSSESMMIHDQFSEERRKKLRLAMECLTQKQREAIFLKFYQQLSYKEVASVIGITTKATYKLVGRSISLLRNKMIGIIIIITTFFTS